MLEAQGRTVAIRVAAILEGATADPVEIDELLSAADTAYYDEDAPLVDDATYDRLADLQRRLTGQAHQVLGEVSGELVAVPHAYPTLSLQKAYSADEVREFKLSVARTLGLDGPDALPLTVEPKIDGLTLVLHYTDGTLTRALTRGNGRIGEDVTHNVRGLSGVPSTIAEPNGTVYIRGEAYLPLSRFAALQAAGEDVATARNTAAGDLRRKTGSQSTVDGVSRAVAHGITFLAYNLDGEIPIDRIPTQADVLALLSTWGFTVPEYRLASEGPAAGEDVAAPTSQTGNAMAELLDTLAGADYGMDGLVLKVASRSWQRRLGASEKTPRWAIAYKLLGAEYETTVRAVQWQVGRVGQVTPVLIADPVDMDGAQVTHYTAHHAAFYRSLGAGIGARIVVTRAGEVIPKVLRLAPGQEPDPELPLPDRCPSCDTPLVLRNGKVLECHNDACPPKLRKALAYFAARDNMDIEGLGQEVIDALITAGLVRSAVDLYRLEAEGLAEVPLANGQRYGATRSAKLLTAIEASRARPFSTVLHALGAPGVGYPECRTIARHFGLVDLLALATGPAPTLQERLIALHGIGPATAAAMATFLAEHEPWIAQLPGVGLRVEREDPPQSADGPLSGKSFVVTGSLEMGSREDVEAWIRARGGTVASAVSGTTGYLVTGVKPGGNKVKAAARHGVPTLDEAALHALARGE